MAFLVWRAHSTAYGDQRRIVSGRLRTREAATAAAAALGAGHHVVEIPRGRLDGLGHGAFLRGDETDGYSLAAGPETDLAARERLALTGAWQAYIRHRPTEAWRDDYVAGGIVRAVGRSVHHALALGRHAADGTGPWDGADEAARRAAVAHVADWVAGSRDGGQAGPRPWFEAMTEAGASTIRDWARIGLTASTPIRCGLFVPARTGAPETATTPAAMTAWSATLGDTTWR